MVFLSEILQHGVQKMGAGIALILNSFLIYLIMKKSPKELGVYRYLMIFISVLEIMFAVVDVLVSPIIHNVGLIFLLITRLDSSWFDPTIQLTLTGFYCALYGSCMALFGIHFIYRYLVIKGDRVLETFHSWKILVWFSVPVIFGIVWGTVAVVFCGPRDSTNRIIENELSENLGLEMDDVVYVAIDSFDDNKGIYWPALIGLMVDFMIIGSSFFTVIYFGALLHKELQKYIANNKNLSVKNKLLQTQLYYSLVIQTLIPIIFLQVPVSSLFIMSFCSLNLGEFSGLVSMTIGVYPAIDPLPTMFIVTSYRNAIRDFVKKAARKFGCASNVTIPTVQIGSVETTKL